MSVVSAIMEGLKTRWSGSSGRTAYGMKLANPDPAEQRRMESPDVTNPRRKKKIIQYQREELLRIRQTRSARAKSGCLMHPGLEMLLRDKPDFGITTDETRLDSCRRLEEPRKRVGQNNHGQSSYNQQYGQGQSSYNHYGQNNYGGYQSRHYRDRDNLENRDRKWNYNNNYRDRGGYEEEPEWFSEGPMTQNDKIELTGFADDRRCKTSNNQSNQSEFRRDAKSSNNDSAQKWSNVDKSKPETDISFDKFLGVDSISSIIPNGLLEQDSAGSSRFSHFFQRNSDVAQVNGEGEGRRYAGRQSTSGGLNNQVPSDTAEAVKSKAAKDIEVALRSILLVKPPPPVEQKPPQPKDDAGALKKLLEQMIIKGNSKK